MGKFVQPPPLYRSLPVFFSVTVAADLLRLVSPLAPHRTRYCAPPEASCLYLFCAPNETLCEFARSPYRSLPLCIAANVAAGNLRPVVPLGGCYAAQLVPVIRSARLATAWRRPLRQCFAPLVHLRYLSADPRSE